MRRKAAGPASERGGGEFLMRRRALRARGTQPPGIGVKQANESRSKRKSGLRRSHLCG